MDLVITWCTMLIFSVCCKKTTFFLPVSPTFDGAVWRYRTLKHAIGAVVVVWLTSFALMFPVLLFADHVPQTNRISGGDGERRYSCVVRWPSRHALAAARAYLTYTAVIGFVCPLIVVVSLYTLLLCRLRVTRRHIRSRASRICPAPSRHVFNVVTLIVATYIICWLPYWTFQVRTWPPPKISVALWRSG